MKLSKLKIAMATGLGVISLSGCMGQMATTGMVTKFNLKVVDNRYGREGMFILLSPVYAIASVADLFIFNAVEFWTGTNPITKKSPAVVDTPVDAMIKVNDKLDSSLTTVPVAMNTDIEEATMQQIDENTLQMNVTYLDGTQKTLRGEKADDAVNFYLNDELITTVRVSELENYVAASQI
ncbi:DUF3332 domain-containing protein [Vibrio hannami]|uniref:DUF3332 domain-containing protein n=1 Tax=Vibrio hannami TaxID=2717094 RepID=UPI00240F7CCA|nr:DUF3332 domain-containing protein [Vibrio hannami]MDG3085665.1 DUF3332 domain-containing protein [Vibrio hannami]